MNNEQIIEVLSDWNFWEKDIDTGIHRKKYIEKINKLINTGQIVAVTGIRRSGKSTLMKQFIKEKISLGENKRSFLYVNFEEPKFADLLSLEFLQQIYDAYIEIIKPEESPYILLDEIQNIPNWERFVRGLHEKKEAKILISGSTSKLFSEGLGTLITGRWLDLDIYPLDFKEFLNFKDINIIDNLSIISNKIKIKQSLREYLEFGGFPLVALQEEKSEILRRYFEDIIIRDVGEKNNIRKLKKLKSLAKYYLTNFSSLISYRKISKFMDLSLDSIERFSNYMQEAYLIFFVPKFSYSLKEQEVNLRKVYCIDPGLVNLVSFRFSENIGRLYENLVFLLLTFNEKEVYYYKDKYECDFVIKEGKKITNAIQVCYNLNKENEEREFNGLIEAMNKLK